MADTETVESQSDFGKKPEATYGQWSAEVRAYEKTFGSWSKRAKAIQKRYRAEDSQRSSVDDLSPSKRLFNIFWSNVETLKPALYSAVPKADISRKHKDRNPVARAAAVVLERTVQEQLDSHGFDQAMTCAVLDYLITGRGQVWCRYDPTYGEERRDRIYLQESIGEDGSTSYRREDTDEEVEVEGVETDDEGRSYIEDGEPYAPVVSECVKVDHVNWQDFGHTSAPSWGKVRAPWKREMMTRDQLKKRFTRKPEGSDKTIGELCALDKMVANVTEEDASQYGDVFRRAEVYEICDVTSGKRIWISSGYPNGPLDEIDEPLSLTNFFPCPKPLYATVTTDSLVPVPDYDQYQSQADDIDRLTQRMHLLMQALKVAGVYDSELGDKLQSLLHSNDNTLIPVDSWAMFAEKGGLRGVMDFLPVREIAQTLGELNQSREQLKNDIYELTGLSDIVRGQGNEGGARTAAEQRIKAQYAGMRISDRQLAVSKFAREIVQIVAEIVAEQFSPETLLEASGWETSDEAREIDKQYAAWEEMRQQVMQAWAEYQGQMQAQQQLAASGQAPAPQQGPNGAQGAPEPPQPPEIKMEDIPEPPPTSKEVFEQAVELLRSDRTRGFAIDIETDSMILQDQQQEQENRTQLADTVASYLTASLGIIQVAPEARDALFELLGFIVRGFKIGRGIEGSLESMMDSFAEADTSQGQEEQQQDPAAMMKVQVDLLKEQNARQKAEADTQIAMLKLEGERQRQASADQIAQIEAMIKASQIKADMAKTRQDGMLRAEELDIERQRAMQEGAMGAAQLQSEQAIAGQDGALRAAEITANVASAERADAVKLATAKMAADRPKGGK